LDTGLVERLADLAALGGPVVILLCCLSVATLAVVLYKLWQFRAAGVGRHLALQQAVDAWDQGQEAAAQEFLRASSSYLKSVLALGFEQRVSSDRLEADAEERFAKLESGFRFLDSVAQLAPLLGLFGTVLGMISAFQALQEAGNQVDPSTLAGGIWVALLTTAVGLGVAMPTSLVLEWFEARMDADRVLAWKAIQTIVTPRGAAGSKSVTAVKLEESLA